MKKFFALLLTIGISLSLVACNTENSSAEKKETTSSSQKTDKKQEKEAKSKDNDATEDVEGLGKVTIVGVGYNDEIGIDGTDDPLKPIKLGSAKLTIEQLHIVDIDPTDDAKQLYFNDEDKVRAVVIDMKAENTSKKDVMFHPNQSVLVTDSGEQLESDMMLMGEAGGDFLGKVTKEGQTWWILKNKSKVIKNIKMIISPPTDNQTLEDIGEEKRLNFQILDYEAALKKDKK
ncbi:hypothetical protein [Bacillus safensis]|uniref:hypothetical protein n=1 Tax=Bacillus safensis TaxID=561879 RepID=UPI001CD6B444|nr:hypothetical protein [Bacillus safensis]